MATQLQVSWIQFEIPSHTDATGPKVSPMACSCGCSACNVPMGPPPITVCGGCIIASIGAIIQKVADFLSSGFGMAMGATRSYLNRAAGSGSESANVGAGNKWQMKDTSYLVRKEGSVAVMGQANSTLWFDQVEGGFQPSFDIKETLTFNRETDRYQLHHLDGSVTSYHGTSGVLVEHRDPAGNVVQVTSYTENKFNAAEIQRSNTEGGDTTVESFQYSYVDPDEDFPLISSVLLRRKVNAGSFANVERVLYTYYGAAEAHGDPNDLKTVERQNWNDSSWDSLGKTYYRYWVAPPYASSSSGAGPDIGSLLRFVVNPASFARLSALEDPLTASNATIAQYADHFYEYDAEGKATKTTVEGGSRSYELVYTESENPDGYNSWKTKSVEDLPDGNQMIVYANYAGQTMLSVLKSGSDEWCQFSKYDETGKIVLSAMPSAISGFDDEYADLLHEVDDNYEYLRDEDGLIRTYTYHEATGYLASESIQQGELGESILLHEYEYVACEHSSSSSSSGAEPEAPETFFLSRQIDYPDDPIAGDSSSSSGPARQIITNFDYTWYSDTCRVQERVTTLPEIPVEQNGTGVSATRREYFDVYGNNTYQMDERGFITRMSFDIPTGAMTQRIDDVDTEEVSDEPAGWETPAGGGLHLVTDYTHDDEGRITQVLGPSHEIDIGGVATAVRRASWTVYIDGSFEVRSAQGYQTSGPAYTLINPVSISKTDKDGKPTESIQATRASTSGALSAGDSFPQSSYVRWSTMQYSDGWHLSSQRAYKLIPSSGDGSSGTNYDASLFGYDSMFRQNRNVTPGGTINRTVFDARSNPAESWVGTNDNGATESDPTGGGAMGNNMVLVTSNVYDVGVDGGDNNVTQQTQHVDGSTTRVTSYLHDWRNRLTDVDSEEDFYTKSYFDNLDRVIKSERNDTDLEGNLVARSVTHFDDRNRVYQTIRYGVDPTTGDVGNSLIDNTWYDAAGNVIKSLPSGSQLFTKSFYDGIGRATIQYMGHNVEETGYPEPDVDDDTIMEQVESLYDDASNVIETLSRQRYHNASGTGALVDPSSEPKARVTYMASYPDAVGRNQASADYGTNGGTTLTRSDTVPARADSILISSMAYDSAGNVESSTDPAGVVSCFEHDDLGREVQRVMNCITSSSSSSDCGCGCPNTEDCAESDDQNVTIETAYNADGNVASITAVNADTGNQVTQYTYGTTLSDSDIASSLLKRFEAMPDSTGGDDRLKFAYNRQGEIVSLTDQNGSVHEYVYDGLGRQIADKVSTVGSGVNDAVLRISTSYEVRGVPLNITSHDEASSGSVVNDVQREYNDFAQLVAEYQSHSGAVNTMTTPKCQYQYEDGSGNTIRPTALVYPNGRVLSYIYEDALSRITSIVDQDDTHLVDYSYLGLSSIVETESPEPGLLSTLIGIDGGDDPDTGDVYRGLDRFARVKDLIWTSQGGSSSSSSSPATVVDRIQHGYDRASNRIWRAQLADPERKHDEFYTYDRLHRLKKMDRGTLNSGKTAIENPTFGQCWSLDATGNWRGFKEDKQGDGKWDLVQSRSANEVNEITSIKTHTSGLPMALPAPLGGRVGRGLWVQPRYDKNGNMVRMPRPAEPTKSFDAVYDAWNRLVDLGVGQYEYDGLRRRTVKVAGGETRHFYYSAGWQDLEERAGASSSADRQFVWGQHYIDDLVLRDRGAERLYAMHDPNWNVTAICDEAGVVQERYKYDAYGRTTYCTNSFSSLNIPSFDWEHFYASYRRHPSEGLIHVRFREYHPELGVWVQRDPISSSSNQLAYSQSPLYSTDPFGLAPKYGYDFPSTSVLGEVPFDRFDPLHFYWFQKKGERAKTPLRLHGAMPEPPEIIQQMPGFKSPPFEDCGKVALWITATAISIGNRTLEAHGDASALLRQLRSTPKMIAEVAIDPNIKKALSHWYRIVQESMFFDQLKRMYEQHCGGCNPPSEPVLIPVHEVKPKLRELNQIRRQLHTIEQERKNPRPGPGGPFMPGILAEEGARNAKAAVQSRTLMQTLKLFFIAIPDIFLQEFNRDPRNEPVS